MLMDVKLSDRDVSKGTCSRTSLQLCDVNSCKAVVFLEGLYCCLSLLVIFPVYTSFCQTVKSFLFMSLMMNVICISAKIEFFFDRMPNKHILSFPVIAWWRITYDESPKKCVANVKYLPKNLHISDMCRTFVVQK